MWDRWQKGDSLHQIARLFDRYHTSIRGILAETGGIRPAPRRRSRLALTLAEREDISRAVVAGHSIRSIASSLGRAPSTISREIKRNGGQGCYRASQAARPLTRPERSLATWTESDCSRPEVDFEQLSGNH
jgi:IS30 family transposase